MNEHNDKIIDELYQQANQDLPPKALDHLILNKANSSTQIPASQNSWRPWLAAASVVFAIPMIWYITQHNELTEYQAPLPSVVAPKVMEEEQAIPNEVLVDVEMAEPAASRPYAAPAMADNMVNEMDGSTDAEKTTGSGSQIKQSSLEANRELLKSEFKAKKKTIKQSNLDPIMALELQQFEQYLSENRLDDAEQLLSEIQLNYPDFNYDELIELLLAAKTNQ